jgi:ribosomal protein S15P/S13E
MQSFIKTLLFATLTAGAILPVYADSCGLRDQMDRIERRIERGVDHGRLTPREARRLNRERRSIWRLSRELRDDGILSDNDCAILSRRVDRLDEHVRELKHNGRGRSDYDYGYRRNRDW